MSDTSLPSPAHRARSARQRRLVIGLCAAAAVAAAGYLVVALFVAETLTKPRRRALVSSPAALDLIHEDVTFTSTVDAVTLRGWFLPVAGSDRAVVIAHGRNSTRTGDNGQLLPDAAALVGSGYNVLLFDFRAHGLSGGTRYTLGAAEQRDVLGAVAYLAGRGFSAERLGVWAHSMGAAAVLLAAAASPALHTIVADSSFARLDDLLARELPRASGLPGFFNPPILFFGKMLFGMDTTILNPVDAVGALPPGSLFVIHAEADGLVPVEHAHRIAAAAGPAVHDLWIVPGARHDRVSAVVPDEYRARVLAFFGARLG